MVRCTCTTLHWSRGCRNNVSTDKSDISVLTSDVFVELFTYQTIQNYHTKHLASALSREVSKVTLNYFTLL